VDRIHKGLRGLVWVGHVVCLLSGGR
jgi:hypothetical protein